jgi:hypothetical protein
MGRKAEEEPIVGLSAILGWGVGNAAGRPPTDAQQAEDRQDMPYLAGEARMSARSKLTGSSS